MRATDRKKPAVKRRRKIRWKRRMQAYMARALFLIIILTFLFGMITLFKVVWNLATGGDSDKTRIESVIGKIIYREPKKRIETPPELIVDLLTYNDYSRVGHVLPEVKNVFVHYTANVGTGAAQNRSYFENLKDTHETSASAHFIIGIEGEIIQCIPTTEVAYAVAGRNYDSVSIECCYAEESGVFTEATYQSLVHLTAWLISKYDLDTEDILRHYDDNGKLCPKYYVENEGAWEQFRTDVADYIEENGFLSF